jgi:hypothetical protein
MRPLRAFFVGGSAGNEQLTAVVATLLILLLAAEGATILRIRSLLTVHAFVGMLLIPVVVLKLGSTGWRMLRYYRRADEYVRRGPPHVALRVIVAPVVIVSTIVLFGTGIALLAVDQVNGPLVGLHKASFVVWVVATALHVLAHLAELPRAIRARLPGSGLRWLVLGVCLVAGVAIAMGTLPAAEALRTHAEHFVGLDR